MSTPPVFRIGIVAGEKSGDALGAGLIEALKQQLPNAEFSGLGGPAMQAAGLHSIADMERLSVMGLVEPLKRLPDLFALRRELLQHFLSWPADIVIGIDSPDFNLGLERRLKKRGLLCCHYVCPSVWAWRQGRVKTIRRSVDYVLALLPFETAFLQSHGIAASFVGHPLADEIAATDSGLNHSEIRADDKTILCVMPGSRQSEVTIMAETQMQVVKKLLDYFPALQVVVPAVSEELQDLITQIAGQAGVPADRIAVQHCPLQRQSLDVMRSADLVLLTSGTATLEAALLGKPMVVVYRMAALGYALAKRLVKIDHIALPNLLASRRLVPEFVQEEATVENIFDSVRELLEDSERRQRTRDELLQLRDQLARNASQRAAAAVVNLLESAAQSGSK